MLGKPSRRIGLAPSIVFTSAFALAAPAFAGTYNASCDVSDLISKVQSASASGGTVFLASGCTYSFTGGYVGSDVALPTITGTVVIEGQGATLVRNASAQFRLLVVDTDANLTLKNVTVKQFKAQDGHNGSGADFTTSAGNGTPGGDGGAIFSYGALTLDHVSLTGNAAGNGGQGGQGYVGAFGVTHYGGSGGAGGRGGGVFASYVNATSALTIETSALAHNTSGAGGAGGDSTDPCCVNRGGNGNAGGDGGAIWSDARVPVTITSSTIFANTAADGGRGGYGTGSKTNGAGGNGGSGGGLFARGALVIDDSTVEGNVAGDGGQSNFNVDGSNQPGGNGGNGGGIDIATGSLTMRRSTVSWNVGGSAGYGGDSSPAIGKYASPGSGGGVMLDTTGTIQDSTFARNTPNVATCGPGGMGGGLFVNAHGVVDVKNDTFTGNTPGPVASCQGSFSFPGDATGGSIHSWGTVRISNSILVTPDDYYTNGTNYVVGNCGGGGFSDASPADPNVPNDKGHNVAYWKLRGVQFSDACPGTFQSFDPLLADIQHDTTGDGPTPGSAPATVIAGAIATVNAGLPSKCTSTDERGVTRPQGATCDMGAVEVRSGSVTTNPTDTTATAPASASFTAGFTPGEGGSGASVQWQMWNPAATVTWGDISGATSSTYTRSTTSYTDNGALFRAVFTDAVGKVTSNSAKLTVRYGRLTIDLPATKTANNSALFQLLVQWDSNPAFTSLLWEKSTDGGTTWGNLYPNGAIDVSNCPTCGTNYTDTATTAMNGWKLRFTLSGGYAGRPSLVSTVCTLTVTNDPVAPFFDSRYPEDSVAIENDTNNMATFVAFVGGNPLPTIGWRKLLGAPTFGWVDLTNGTPTDFDAYHFNTTPGQNNSAFLQFRAWGDQDGGFYDSVLNGSVFSKSARLWVAVPTITTVACPSEVLSGSQFTCNVTVAADPARGPRTRKPCGTVINGNNFQCDLNADAQCAITGNGIYTGTHGPISVTYVGGTYHYQLPPDCANGLPADLSSVGVSNDIEGKDCVAPPIQVCPASQTGEADATTGTVAVPDFTATTVLGAYYMPTAQSWCVVDPTVGQTLTQDPAAGTLVGAGSHTVTITATSAAGSHTCTTAFIVTCPNAPVITLNGDNPQTLDCDAPYIEPGATATACNGEVPVRVTANDLNPGRPGTYTITYEAGATTATRTVIVADKTPPEVILNGPSTIPIPCHAPAFIDPGATAFDACERSNPTVTVSGNLDLNTPGTYTLTYKAKDSSGNEGTATRTVVVLDGEPPVVTLNGDVTVTVECHGAFVDPGATALDACAGPVPVTVTGTVNVNQPGLYTLGYSAKDPSGNTSNVVNRMVQVVDTTKPTVTLKGASTMTLSCGSRSFVDPGATASDLCAGTLPVNVSGAVNPAVPGPYTLTYTAVDPSGNQGSATRTVTVLAVDPPTITLNGASPMTLECHASSYVEPGAVGHDGCGGSGAAIPSGAVDVNTPGVYTITYSYTDAFGNVAAPVTRTVNVLDTTKPVITVNGLASVNVECHGTYTDAGATAVDSCAGSLPVTPAGAVDVNTPGTYTITYSAKDPSGNVQTATRTVKVGDSTAPVLTLNGTSPVTVECHGSYTDLGATATDACSGTFAATPSGLVDVNTPGTYTVTYNAQDASGNAAAPITRTVVVADTTKPTISVPSNITVAAVPGTCGAPATFTVTRSDVCDPNPKLVLSHASGSTFPMGATTVTATATDASGNVQTASFTVTVTKTPTSTSLALSPSTQQYSDAETLTATVVDGLTSSPVAGGTVTFKIGGSTVGTSSIGAGGIATLSLNLVDSASLAKADLAPGNHTVTAIYNGDAACYAGSSDTKTLTITQENATLQYTGLNWAPACSAASAVVTFSATVTDVADAARGAISNATLTFIDRDKGTTLCTTPVGLVSSADKTIGTGACNATLAVGDYRVGIVVGGFYARNDPDDDDQVLEVATSCGTGIITGGGYLSLLNPAGSNAGDKGSKNNFGFNVKYNKQYTNLQGTINTIVRKDGRLYQVKGNSMTSLQTNTSVSASHPSPTAIFFGKASLQDVTDPLNPIPLPNGGGAILRVTMTDRSDPKGGASALDTIGITVWYSQAAGGGLFFSSNWDGSTTVEQPLGGQGGGNLSVR
jgi:Bacterial surface protein, Ig-like domain/Bacterial Ig-like domain (group 3)/HYR domain